MSVSPKDIDCAASQTPRIERIGTALPQPGFVVLRLFALDGSRIIEIYQPQALIGRHSHADIRLPDRDVSRQHCRLIFTGGQWYVEDLGSLNGTYVNGEAVRRAALRPNAILTVAGHAFLVTWPQLDSTIDCPAEEVHPPPEVCSRARQVLARIADQLSEQPSN